MGRHCENSEIYRAPLKPEVTFGLVLRKNVYDFSGYTRKNTSDTRTDAEERRIERNKG